MHAKGKQNSRQYCDGKLLGRPCQACGIDSERGDAIMGTPASGLDALG